MTETVNLQLPYILPSQAQKHVTHNEALRLLDGIVQLAVLGRDLAVPPAAPADGDRHIVAGGADGDWTGHDGEVAIRAEGGWMFAPPRAGWVAWIAGEERLVVFDGLEWISPAADNLDMLGVNASADDVNRFAVASEASLFDHAGAGHQHKINKAAASDTASVLFQTGYSGRAEMGLAGDDDFRIKVSADGETWREALIVRGTDGSVNLPAGIHMPDGARIVNDGASPASGLDLEGGGDLGRVGLVIKSVTGLTGALFEQRAAPDSGIDLVDFGLKTLSDQMNLRVESRAEYTLTGSSPEFQIAHKPADAPLEVLAAVSPGAAALDVPLVLKPMWLSTLPLAGSVPAGALVHLHDAPGGAVPIYSDGVHWRKMTDGAVIA